MNYTELFSVHHIATLADWLREKGELFLQIELPHSGGSGAYRTVRSLREIRHAVREIRNPEIEIMIWRNRTQAEFESDNPPADDLKWIYFHPDEVMCLAVRKNRNSYTPYIDDPGKYKKEIDDWFDADSG